MLSACVWLANDLYTVAKYKFYTNYREESFLLIICTWNIRTGLQLVKSLFKSTASVLFRFYFFHG